MHQVTITIGTGFRADGLPLHAGERGRATERVDACAVAAFGGFTRYDTVGAWRNERGERVQESGLCYEIVVKDYEADVQREVRHVAEFARAAFQQESVLLRVSQVDAELITE